MNILISGVSSGTGRQLTKDLCQKGHRVIGIARRKDLLESLRKELPKSAKFKYIQADLGDNEVWEKVIKILKKEKFIPNVVIFNAATWEKKLVLEYDFEALAKMHQVNFLSIMKGLSLLMSYCQGRKTRFIAVSTLSALWGSPVEGIGYPSSKAALSIAFEGFHQRFKETNFSFSCVSFGPIKAKANSFLIFSPFQITLNGAVNVIEKAMIGRKAAYFAPSWLFFSFSLLRLLPVGLKLKIFSSIDSLHPYYLNKEKNPIFGQ